MDAALATLWFLYTHDPSIVITTAPTERQVKECLWREIRYRKAAALQPLAGVPLILKLDLSPMHYALGFSTNDVQQMQGFHSPNIMVIVDEANGYPEELFDALEGLLSGGIRKIFFMIGNPIIPIGKFFDSFSDPEVWSYTMSCLNHPNVITGKNIIPGAVTREWVERQRKLWGEDSAFWQSRVLGQFPKIATDVVVNLAWVEVAEQLVLKASGDKESRYMGIDPGEMGNDDYVWYIGTLRRKLEIVSRKNIEPAECIGITKQLKTKWNISETHITCDGIGAGAAICSVLADDGISVRRFVASNTAKDDKTFEDLSTEAWFNARILLNPDGDSYEGYSFCGRVDRLKADLCTRKFGTSRHGRFQLEFKEIYRKRMKRSCNFADAFMHCYSWMSSAKFYSFVSLPNVIGD